MSNLYSSISKHMDYETFVSIISDIPSCIFFKDNDLKYRFSSHHWSQLVSDDIVGKTDVEIRKDIDNALKAMEEDKRILETKKGCSYVIKSDIEGDVSYLELIKEPIFSPDGDVIGIVGLINDVTQRTLMEKRIVDMSNMLEVQCRELETSNEEFKAALEKVEMMHAAQKMFTASMNHELRSPLNGIIGNLQLLLEDEGLNNEQKDIINNAFASSKLMLEMVNELLDYAKSEMDGFTIKNEAFILSELVDNIRIQIQPQAKAKELDFIVINDVEEKVLVGDEVRITQVMHNFLSNAVKYTESGSITLHISYEDGKLIIMCSDTGQGISEESMRYLFTPFVRFNEKRNINIQGTGLGLSVVKKIIDSMRGEIFVTSKVNEGSTFTVKIPVAVGTIEDINSDKDNSSNYEKVDLSNLNILCVDDSKVNAKVMAALLKKMDMNSDVAFSAKEGIEKADENKYDVIFMDHMMPEMDGLEAFEVIRKDSKLNKDTPIIMLTGNVDIKHAQMYVEKGLDGYLTKPVLKESIIEKITAVLRK